MDPKVNAGAMKVASSADVAEAVAGQNHDSHERGVTSEQRRRELADFLRTRREKLKPEQVGLPQVSRRRTPGLRREEVAELAGVGTTWYTWLEQARDIQPSSDVLRRLGQALSMNAAEVRHLFSLAGKAPPIELSQVSEVIPESLSRILNEALQTPAMVLGQRWDVLALNKQAQEMFPLLKSCADEKKNWLYFIFCMEQTRAKLKDWEENARRLIAQFRASLSEYLDDPWVQELVELLKKDSPEFAQWWREHDVRDHGSAVVEYTDVNGNVVHLERSVLMTPENPRLKVLVLTQVKNN